MRNVYHGAIKRGTKVTFPLWQKLGLHVVPNHFYGPVPDTSALDARLWQQNTELAGVDINETGQLELLGAFSRHFRREYSSFPLDPTATPFEYYRANQSFPEIDAEILYCMVRKHRPTRIIEIGSGFSTFITADAIRKNASEDSGYECDFRAIDPYPNDVVQSGFDGFSGVIISKVEDMPLSTFDQLEDGDILFIDSSHVLKIGSDVQYEFLEVIPRIKPGVLVHVHDIFLPAEYPQEWVMKEHVFWNEQHLLQAFLAFNSSFEVLWSASYMNKNHPDKLRHAFPSFRYGKSRPGSFWFRRIS